MIECFKRVFCCNKNKEKDEGNEIYCPNCHKNIKLLLNKNLDINANDDSKFNILNVNPSFDKTKNKKIMKSRLIFNENNLYNDKKHFEMNNIPNEKLSEINNKNIEVQNKIIKEKLKSLDKKDKELKDRENKLNQEKIRGRKK